MDWTAVGLGVGIATGSVGAVAAVIALVYAHNANKKADQSNTLANDAMAIAARTEARETERHDVYWDCGWRSQRKGYYQLIKRGDDIAKDIKAVVAIDGEEKSHCADEITDEGAGIALYFPNAEAAYATQLHEETTHAYPSRGPALRPHYITVRIEWITQLGTPKLHEDEQTSFFSVR